ncbi:MAG TPA: hypothetical protein DCZ63_14745 [Geobacter sp.]|nr:hypothetical protein [Geobacter sp.]
MSRLSKKIIIGGKKITFTEIPANTILGLFRGENPVYELPVNAAFAEFAQLIPLAIDCPLEQILDLDIYGSDMLAIEEAFKETNPYFFQLALQLDLAGELIRLVKALIGYYCSVSPFLSSVAIQTPDCTECNS